MRWLGHDLLVADLPGTGYWTALGREIAVEAITAEAIAGGLR